MDKTTCSIEGCERPSSARGWCRAHYARWTRVGDVSAEKPLGLSRAIAIPPIQRVMRRVHLEDRGHLSPCWVWEGAHDDDGYGQIGVADGRTGKTHQITYRHYVGPILAGLQIDHLCRVRICCNPMHLEAVTSKENTLRGDGITARNARKTRCQAGHAYDDANTYIYRGERRCRSCKKLNREKSMKKLKQIREQELVAENGGRG